MSLQIACHTFRKVLLNRALFISSSTYHTKSGVYGFKPEQFDKNGTFFYLFFHHDKLTYF